MKKILIVTYYWPPLGGGGVQRWLKFAKYLPEYGWNPIIFTPENPNFSIKDPTLASDVPDGVEVIRYPIWEPYAVFDAFTGKKSRLQGILTTEKNSGLFQKTALWIRGNIFIPDPKIAWIRPSVRFLTQYLKTNKIDCLVTTGPPHSMHLIGLKLKKQTGVKWIADFRDPWSRWDMLTHFNLTKLAKNAHNRLEKKVVEHTDLVLTVSPSWASDIRNDHNCEVDVITNGFDKQDFTTTYSGNHNEFIINHSGLINDFRNPVGLWDAVTELCNENDAFKNSFKFRFSGMVSRAVLNYLHNSVLFRNKFEFLGYLPHDTIIEHYSRCAVNLLLLNESPSAKGHIPAKLFEYLASRKYILGLGPVDSDAAKIIDSAGAGKMCSSNDKKSIKNTLNDFFNHYKNSNFPNTEGLEKYTRKALTGQLATILDRL